MLQTEINGHMKRQVVYETSFGSVPADTEDAVVAAFVAVDQAAKLEEIVDAILARGWGREESESA